MCLNFHTIFVYLSFILVLVFVTEIGHVDDVNIQKTEAARSSAMWRLQPRGPAVHFNTQFHNFLISTHICWNPLFVW